MDCQTAHLLIEAFHDDELPVADAACLLAHVESCPPCQGRFDSCEELSAALRGRRLEDRCPDEVKRRLLLCLEERLASRARRERRRWSTITIGAVSLGAGLAMGRFLAVRSIGGPAAAFDTLPALSSASGPRWTPRAAARVEGELFCASCELARRYPSKRGSFAGHQAVLKTADGHLYTVVGPSCDGLLDSDHECRSVSVLAQLHPDTSTAVLLSISR